jgi:hypothetical protein
MSSPTMQPYFQRRNEISLQDGILMWGSRVIIPDKGRHTLLEELHNGHPGIVKMKSLARSLIWWPNIDSDIECMVRTCNKCQINRPKPTEAPVHVSIITSIMQALLKEKCC